MRLVCVATSRTTSTVTERYLEMAEQSPGWGHVKVNYMYSNTDNGVIDFTDPHRAIYRDRNTSVEHFLVSRGDIIHGFPNSQTMTNLIRWMGHYICFTDGLIWTINVFTKAWNVVGVRNSDDYEWQPNSRNDFLYVVDDRLTLAKFLPSRTNCDRVILHEYTLIIDFNYPDNTSGRGVDSHSILSSDLLQSRFSTLHSEYHTPGISPIRENANTALISTAFESLSTSDNEDQLAHVQESITEEGKGSNYSSCKICLADYDRRPRSAIVPCGHVACSNCISESRKENNRCPFCRKNIENVLRLFE